MKCGMSIFFVEYVNYAYFSRNIFENLLRKLSATLNQIGSES